MTKTNKFVHKFQIQSWTTIAISLGYPKKDGVDSLPSLFLRYVFCCLNGQEVYYCLIGNQAFCWICAQLGSVGTFLVEIWRIPENTLWKWSLMTIHSWWSSSRFEESMLVLPPMADLRNHVFCGLVPLSCLSHWWKGPRPALGFKNGHLYCGLLAFHPSLAFKTTSVSILLVLKGIRS